MTNENNEEAPIGKLKDVKDRVLGFLITIVLPMTLWYLIGN